MDSGTETEDPKIMRSFQEMFWKAGGMKRPIAKLKSQYLISVKPLCLVGGVMTYQLATDARAIPVARVSRDQTSAAYTQAIGTKVRELISTRM